MKLLHPCLALMVAASLLPTQAAAGWKEFRQKLVDKDASASGSVAATEAQQAQASSSDLYEQMAPTSAGRMSTTLSAPLSRDTQVAAVTPATMPATVAPVAATASSALAMASAVSPNRFDLAVNNAPAAQVFLQLGSGSAYNMLVSPEVSGTITISLKNTTVPEALESLRELFGYDFRITGNRVFVYPNTVQTRMFRINYLPGRRLGASDLRVSSSSLVQSGTSSSSSGSTTSTTSSSSATNRSGDTASVHTTSDNDFWRDVQDSLKSMLGSGADRSVMLNPGAGVIVVRGTPAELRQVAEYLRAVQITIERQVMLEAKIVEVSLSEAQQTGVNWSLFSSGSTKIGAVNAASGVTLSNSGSMSNSSATITAGSSVVTEALGKGFYGLAVQGANFAALLSFLETQGDVQVLSSPRIAALNNQKAVLKVGTDALYVTNVSTNSTSTTTSTTNSPTVTLQPFFSGISLDVTPQIDDNGTVMLHVHPAVTDVSEETKVIDLGNDTTLKLPLATSAINETDSVVRVRDGQIVAIGGLMQQTASRDRSGVPGLSKLPLVGNLFSYKSNTKYKHELVILIKPTIVKDDGTGWTNDVPATPLISDAR
jgi:MSHA biogenesis protein MshL